MFSKIIKTIFQTQRKLNLKIITIILNINMRIIPSSKLNSIASKLDVN